MSLVALSFKQSQLRWYRKQLKHYHENGPYKSTKLWIAIVAVSLISALVSFYPLAIDRITSNKLLALAPFIAFSLFCLVFSLSQSIKNVWKVSTTFFLTSAFLLFEGLLFWPFIVLFTYQNTYTPPDYSLRAILIWIGLVNFFLLGTVSILSSHYLVLKDGKIPGNYNIIFPKWYRKTNKAFLQETVLNDKFPLSAGSTISAGNFLLKLFLYGFLPALFLLLYWSYLA